MQYSVFFSRDGEMEVERKRRGGGGKAAESIRNKIEERVGGEWHETGSKDLTYRLLKEN